MDPTLVKLALIFVAVVVGIVASAKAGYWMLADNREKEWPDMEKSEPLSRPILDWTIAHIRDDLGSIFVILAITNGLLAGILAVLVLNLLH